MSSVASRYTFKPVSACNLCGSTPDQHRVMGKRADRSQGLRPWRSRAVTTTVVRCRRCDLVFADPQPIPFDLQDHYGVPPEAYWRSSYFEVDAGYFAREIENAKSLLKRDTGIRALDIGAGLGKAMIAMERAGFEAHGFEPSAPFHQRAIERMGIRPDRLRLGGVEELEYPAGMFDLITFGAVLEHLYDPQASIEKALRWLAPGGVIHIEVPSSRWLMNAVFNTVYRAMGSDYVANISPMHTPYHLYEFDRKSFDLGGERGGYRVVRHYHYVCQTYAPAVLDPLLRWYMARTGRGMQLTVWLGHRG
ncbi:MAG: class I SAM-dependent methyltransferase [Flavobacteriales bacterium]|nr:class I SAM-dependent methyltransferase [Flavobacteriales bacterium]